jgi:AcrR family transcriptional regulator
VTVNAAAAEVGVSKATAYRYFSDARAMAAEAGIAVEIAPFEVIVGTARGPRERVRAVSRYLLDLALLHEAAFRHFLARSLDASLAEEALKSRRGGRRTLLFERALEGGGLSQKPCRRLVVALSAATGVEAMIALLDVANVDREEARTAVLDVADALLDRFGVVE